MINTLVLYGLAVIAVSSLWMFRGVYMVLEWLFPDTF